MRRKFFPASEYNHPSFLEGRCAEIVLKKSGQVVGLFGTVQRAPGAPEVLGNFDLPYPTRSAAEIDLQAFL